MLIKLLITIPPSNQYFYLNHPTNYSLRRDAGPTLSHPTCRLIIISLYSAKNTDVNSGPFKVLKIKNKGIKISKYVNIQI